MTWAKAAAAVAARSRDYFVEALRERPKTMEQDPEVVALAAEIYKRWMRDERWRKAHLHPPQAPQDFPIAYFWAELAAKAALGR